MSRTNYPFKVNNADIPCPSKCIYGLQDVSKSDSGRVEDPNATMYKNRIAQKVKLELEWVAVSDADAATILTAFDPEYFSVTYHDPKANATTTKTFYCGDRTATYYWWVDNKGFTYQNVAFNIIER